LTERLPHLPDGRIDYANRPALVVTCFVKFQTNSSPQRSTSSHLPGKWIPQPATSTNSSRCGKALETSGRIGAEDIRRITFGEPDSRPAIKNLARAPGSCGVEAPRRDQLNWGTMRAAGSAGRNKILTSFRVDESLKKFSICDRLQVRETVASRANPPGRILRSTRMTLKEKRQPESFGRDCGLHNLYPGQRKDLAHRDAIANLRINSMNDLR
jgi:hypothetical protein